MATNSTSDAAAEPAVLPTTTTLPIGSPSPSRNKRKRSTDPEDAAAATSKREKKRSKKRKERDSESPRKKEKKKEKKEKKDKKTRHPSPPSPESSTPTVPPPDSTAASPPPKSSLRKHLEKQQQQHLRKSVSFTPDTKATDGDSIKTLYQNYDPFAHYDSYQQHIADYPTNELPRGFDDEEEEQRPKEPSGGGEAVEGVPDKKKRRKEKKQKKRELREDAEDDVGGGSARLTYLLTYHTARETWKFEKSKQNWILRHAFDAARIPEEEYGEALKSYIAGLQSAAARDRLLGEANEVVKRGKDTISKDGEKIDAADQKINVTRAKLVLAALGHGDDDEEDSSSSSDDE